MSNVGDECFGINEGYFEYETLEEALEAQWDQTDPCEKTLTIFEGEVGKETIFDDEYDADLHRVINVKARKFQVLKNAEYFELSDFKETTKA